MGRGMLKGRIYALGRQEAREGPHGRARVEPWLYLGGGPQVSRPVPSEYAMGRLEFRLGPRGSKSAVGFFLGKG